MHLARLGLTTYSALSLDDCDPGRFVEPKVGMDSAPVVLDPLVALLDETEPRGQAPVRAALEGAFTFASADQASHPYASTHVILVAGPESADCEEPLSTEELLAMAEPTTASPPTLRAVLLDVDPEPDPGCGEAGDPVVHVSSDAGPEAVLAALLAVRTEFRRSGVRCEYYVPDPPEGSSGIQYEATRVVYEAPQGPVLEVPLVSSAAACDASEYGGFYFGGYDEVGKPHQLTLCPCSCRAAGDAGSAPSLSFPCQGGFPRPD